MVAMLIAIIIFTSLWVCKKDREFIYVHTKTGNRYRIFQNCLMKYDGKWVDAVIYISMKNNEIYVKAYDDFILEFKRLSEWKEN